jgi:hypothetical protein
MLIHHLGLQDTKEPFNKPDGVDINCYTAPSDSTQVQSPTVKPKDEDGFLN